MQQVVVVKHLHLKMEQLGHSPVVMEELLMELLVVQVLSLIHI